MLEKIKELYLQLSKNGEQKIVIGGTYALELHGLIQYKDPEDIDVIVYKPTK